MQIVFYFLVGLVVAFIGALPFGTVNLSVIHTTVNHNTHRAMRIAYTAALAEILLALIAMNFGMMVIEYLMQTTWIIILLIVVLFILGIHFLLKEQTTSIRSKDTFGSEYFKGFILGLLNPPVLIYWIFILGVIQMYQVNLNLANSIWLPVIFLIGVFLGKVVSLYFYSGISTFIKNKIANAAIYMNRIIGTALVAISLVQMVKLLIS
ncbi:LysE family transporter [Flavobacteriaceae bacterium M23B6Z8]